MTRIADIIRPECPVFYIDNVAEYWFTAGGASTMQLTYRPPFDDVWIEYFLPKNASTGPPSRFAFRFTVEANTLYQDALATDIERAASHIATVKCYIGHGEEVKVCPFFMSFWLSPDGAMEGESGDDIGDTMRSLLWPCWLAVAFSHCKNVRTVERTPAGPFERARKRRGEPPSLKYHVLEIDPMRTVLKKEGKVDEVGIARALHICRGHFRTYDETKRLFGRLTGTFWVPAHVRGNPSEGVVVKDYSVKAPA